MNRGCVMEQSVEYVMEKNALAHGLSTPPAPPNMKFSFGDSNTWFSCNCKTKPNRFQRWMLRKVFGIYTVDLEVE